MTRHFSIPKMLRMTPKVLLREFFERLGQPLAQLDWANLPERHIEPLLQALAELPPLAQEQIESNLAVIFELACASGAQAIREASSQTQPALPEDADLYGRALWSWLHAPAVFNQARLIQQVEQLSRWRKRKGLPRVTPRTEAKPALATALAQLLHREEGRGQQCTVEHFRRPDGTDYFVAYPDDFLQTVNLHDEQGRLVPRPLRPTFEIVFAYHREQGTLDLFAKLSSRLKPKLEKLFAQIILERDLVPNSVLPYDLNRLKDRYFCLDTDPEDRLSASIRRLRLEVARGQRLTVEQENGDIHQALDTCLNKELINWEKVTISKATICFRFEPTFSRRPKALTFDVTYPDRCHLKSRYPDCLDLTRKYLKRWRIANV